MYCKSEVQLPGQQKVMEAIVAEETAVEEQSVERPANEKIIVKGMITKKLKGTQSAVDDLC